MVIAATVIWTVGMMFFLVVGFTFAVYDGFHHDEPFKKYFKSWGPVRFYTVCLFVGLVLIAIWPIVLVSLWIIALIKGW